MVEAGGADGIIIRKQTMIVKNSNDIDDVYDREKKVSQHCQTPYLFCFLDPWKRNLWRGCCWSAQRNWTEESH